MSSTRIYTVSDGQSNYLVRASVRSQAIAHIAKSKFSCRVATQGDLMTLLPAGVPVLDAKADEPADDSQTSVEA